jgi:hypothetical protein
MLDHFQITSCDRIHSFKWIPVTNTCLKYFNRVFVTFLQTTNYCLLNGCKFVIFHAASSYNFYILKGFSFYKQIEKPNLAV